MFPVKEEERIANFTLVNTKIAQKNAVRDFKFYFIFQEREWDFVYHI